MAMMIPMILRSWSWLVLALGLAWSDVAAAASGRSAVEAGSAKANATEPAEASAAEAMPQSTEQTESTVAEAPPETARAWGVETSLVYPFINIYYLLGSYAFWRSGEALFGLGLQRWSDKTTSGFDKLFPPGRAEAYTVLLGYRQFLWRGLHVEAVFFPAYNRWHSYLDGQIYSGLEVWVEAHFGYKFRYEAWGVVLCAIPQLGLGTGVWKQKTWPGEDSPSGLDRFQFVPNVILGVEL